MGIMDDAKKMAAGHEDQTDAAIDKAGDAKDKTGGKNDDQVETAESKARARHASDASDARDA
jgi:hypothetical protein